MTGLDSLGRLLIIGGLVIAAVGLLLLLFNRLGLGRLPGDIFIQHENVTFYFPLVTMLIISILLSVILNIFRR
ncbi:MAG: DUF2905 domain-containing protein [Dethiobacteria bacterium]|nr:DUF2905 domain-containing protein [Dethiobacteria bacterium]